MEDYSLFIIKAKNLIEKINEAANMKDFEKAREYTFALKNLSVMLVDSLGE